MKDIAAKIKSDELTITQKQAICKCLADVIKKEQMNVDQEVGQEDKKVQLQEKGQDYQKSIAALHCIAGNQILIVQDDRHQAPKGGPKLAFSPPDAQPNSLKDCVFLRRIPPEKGQEDWSFLALPKGELPWEQEAAALGIQQRLAKQRAEMAADAAAKQAEAEAQARALGFPYNVGAAKEFFERPEYADPHDKSVWAMSQEGSMWDLITQQTGKQASSIILRSLYDSPLKWCILENFNVLATILYQTEEANKEGFETALKDFATTNPKICDNATQLLVRIQNKELTLADSVVLCPLMRTIFKTLNVNKKYDFAKLYGIAADKTVVFKNDLADADEDKFSVHSPQSREGPVRPATLADCIFILRSTPDGAWHAVKHDKLPWVVPPP